MKISQKYVDYVKKTANPNYTVEMAACALLEELNEFYTDKTTDELGDVLYQFVLFCQLLDVDIRTLEYTEEPRIEIVLYLTRITSQYKKLATRGKEIDKDVIKENLSSLYNSIIKSIRYQKYNIEEVEEENMKKLNERYGIND